MTIGKLNERITIQKNVVLVDKYKNHTSVWSDYYSCWAYANTYTAMEKDGTVPSEERSISFLVRYCQELAGITSTQYRVLFRGQVYDIVSVDMMNYQKKEIRLTCRKEKR